MTHDEQYGPCVIRGSHHKRAKVKFTRQHLRAGPRRHTENPDHLRHLALESRINRYIAELKTCPLSGTDYVTYAIIERIRAVGQSDRQLPFYVGQTSNLARRARQHFKAGGQPTKDSVSVYGRMYRIMQSFQMPQFEILERKATLAASLLSESMWVQRMRAQGHAVTNQWAEHQPGKFKGSVPAKRLWGCTLRQALIDNLQLSISCQQCGNTLPLPLEQIAAIVLLTTTLQEIRSGFCCPQCQAVPCLKVSAFCGTADEGDG